MPPLTTILSDGPILSPLALPEEEGGVGGGDCVDPLLSDEFVSVPEFEFNSNSFDR